MHRERHRIAASISLVLLLAQCATAPHGPVSKATTARAISRGVDFLWRTQATAATEQSSPRASFEGDWDQFIGIDFGLFMRSLHDTGPFVSAYVCQWLQHVTDEKAATIGLGSDDCAHARDIRNRVLRLQSRFEMPDGTVAYWPLASGDPATLRERFQANFMRIWYGGPALHGVLAPRGVRGLPPEYRTWPDPDCTAMTSVARAICHRIDATSTRLSPDLRSVLAPYRYTGRENLFFPSHAQPPAGVYFGFCVPKDRPDLPHDVDLIVNCNILHALALSGEADSPEARRIIDWINDTVRTGTFRNISDVTLYYRQENFFPYVVARACREGGIRALEHSMQELAQEVRSRAVQRTDGTLCWLGRNPVRATSLALSCLLLAGQSDALTDGAARYLLAQQNQQTGAWRDDWLPLAETASGRSFKIRCDATQTACAIHALCLHQFDRTQFDHAQECRRQ